MASREDIDHIQLALAKANDLVNSFSGRTIQVQHKHGEGPVTEIDLALDELLYRELVRDEEGWLSEETVDDGQRLTKRRIWVVDPIDGTRELMRGIAEWVVSVALVEGEQAIAAGILNPWAHQVFLGAVDADVTLNGETARVTDPATLDGIRVLASRSELRRRRWERRFGDAPIKVMAVGSIAYKMALVAVGRADAVVSLTPKNEWDIAAGALLIEAAGGVVTDLRGQPFRFNQPDTLVEGVIAGGPRTVAEIRRLLDRPGLRLWTPGR